MACAQHNPSSPDKSTEKFPTTIRPVALSPDFENSLREEGESVLTKPSNNLINDQDFDKISGAGSHKSSFESPESENFLDNFKDRETNQPRDSFKHVKMIDLTSQSNIGRYGDDDDDNGDDEAEVEHEDDENRVIENLVGVADSINEVSKTMTTREFLESKRDLIRYNMTDNYQISVVKSPEPDTSDEGGRENLIEPEFQPPLETQAGETHEIENPQVAQLNLNETQSTNLVPSASASNTLIDDLITADESVHTRPDSTNINDTYHDFEIKPGFSILDETDQNLNYSALNASRVLNINEFRELIERSKVLDQAIERLEQSQEGKENVVSVDQVELKQQGDGEANLGSLPPVDPHHVTGLGAVSVLGPNCG